MKKLIALIMSIVMVFPLCMLSACGGNRAQQLKMYIPGEYIDEEIFDEFEAWYKEKTGKTVEVVTPTTFDTVEEILTAVERDKADYDLLLPSDYAVEQLIKKGLVQKIDTERVNISEIMKPEYVERARISDPTLEYSVPYMYGTFGIMYDYSRTGKHIDSWSAIFTDEYSGKSANKDSLREALTSAAIWNNRESLLDGEYDNAKLQAIYEDMSEEAVDAAVNTLRESKKNFLWGGESLTGYIMNDYEDDDGNEHTGNRNIWYVVPKEGGNIYLDCFVISKYAKNAEAANYFLEFLCTKEIALRNSYYAGAVSPVAEAYDALYEEYSSDETLGEGAAAGEEAAWREMYLDMMFPSAETLERCGTMRDYGDRDADISVQWANVRN